MISVKITTSQENNQAETVTHTFKEQNIICIGRSSDNDITLDRDSVSRKHLQIKLENGEFFIKDLTSSNWVSYNDEKLGKDEEVKYFDFSRLILPGDIEIKIEQFTERRRVERVRKPKTIPSKNEKKINSKKTKQTKDGKTEKPIANIEKKEKKQMLLILAFVLVVCLYLLVDMNII